MEFCREGTRALCPRALRTGNVGQLADRIVRGGEMKISRLALVLLAAGLVASPVLAGMPMNLGELSQSADRIFRGKVVDIRSDVAITDGAAVPTNHVRRPGRRGHQGQLRDHQGRAACRDPHGRQPQGLARTARHPGRNVADAPAGPRRNLSAVHRSARSARHDHDGRPGRGSFRNRRRRPAAAPPSTASRTTSSLPAWPVSTLRQGPSPTASSSSGSASSSARTRGGQS